jgi:hypothetical protein
MAVNKSIKPEPPPPFALFAYLSKVSYFSIFIVMGLNFVLGLVFKFWDQEISAGKSLGKRL